MSRTPPQTTRIVPALSAADEEERRWLRLLGFWFLVGFVFWIALFASGNAWFISGVLFSWVGACLLFSLVHLAISSDMNTTTTPEPSLEQEREREPTAAERKAA